MSENTGEKVVAEALRLMEAAGLKDCDASLEIDETRKRMHLTLECARVTEPGKLFHVSAAGLGEWEDLAADAKFGVGKLFGMLRPGERFRAQVVDKWGRIVFQGPACSSAAEARASLALPPAPIAVEESSP